MPRSGRFRDFIKEYKESERFEKFSFIPPFIILSIELILLFHAVFIHSNQIVAILTTILLIISFIELYLVGQEIHAHYQKGNFEREMTIRLDDFILERHLDNVSLIVDEFIQNNQQYKNYRNSIYHICCQIMETHKHELWEKTLRKRLAGYLKKTDKRAIRDIIDSFTKKYPEYRKNPARVYEITAYMIENMK